MAFVINMTFNESKWLSVVTEKEVPLPGFAKAFSFCILAICHNYDCLALK